MHARTHAHAPAHMHGARACPTRVAHLCGPRAAAAALDLQLAKTGDGPARLPRPYARRPAAAAAACPPPATILALAKTRLGCVRGCARVLVPLRASACASTRAPRQCTAAARRAARGRYSSGNSSGSAGAPWNPEQVCMPPPASARLLQSCCSSMRANGSSHDSRRRSRQVRSGSWTRRRAPRAGPRGRPPRRRRGEEREAEAGVGGEGKRGGRGEGGGRMCVGGGGRRRRRARRLRG